MKTMKLGKGAQGTEGGREGGREGGGNHFFCYVETKTVHMVTSIEGFFVLERGWKSEVVLGD